jgi:hypothetical protein
MFLTMGARLQREFSDPHHVFDGHELQKLERTN